MQLTAVDLGYRYPDGTRVGPLTLEVRSGIVHLQGPNGTGKSTLMAVLGGVLPATTGSVRLDGRDPFRDHGVRGRIGAVAATPELPAFLTAEQAARQWAALRGGPRWDPLPALQALALPQGLALGAMSSGQRRRAELVAALAGDPELLLLDETFAHLDDDGVGWLVERLEATRGEQVVVICHHGSLPLEADLQVLLGDVHRRGA